MATEQLWNGFDGKKLFAERAVRDEVGREIATTYAVRADVPSVYNAKLKMKLGAGSAADTGFTANAESDVTVEVPSASASTAGVGGTEGLMSAADKEKLDDAKSYSRIVSGNSHIGASKLNDTLKFVAGDNMVIELGKELIGDREYRVVQIGNQIWMAENLDYKFDGLTVGSQDTSKTVPLANYYNDDEATYGSDGLGYGLLYNWAAAIYLNNHRNTLIPGWHVPSNGEFNALFSAIGGTDMEVASKLKSTDVWASQYAGTDDYGFCAKPTGIGKGYEGLGTNVCFWDTTDYGDNAAMYIGIYEDHANRGSFTSKTGQFALRLVKDNPDGLSVKFTSEIDMEKSIYGDYIADESGQAVLGESGEQIISESAVVLYDTFKGVKFGAARAVADQDGNVFGETYARKLLPAAKAFAASVTVDNNRVTSITGVTGSVAIDITVAPGECANTAVELTTGSSVTADSAVTVTVNGVAAGRAAATDGKISASKKYQVTCVGTCWTMAEFETANA